MNCIACKKHVNISERMTCSCCKGSYHFKCLGISTSQYKTNAHKYNISWVCPECQNTTKRRPRNDNTPVRNITQSSDSESDRSPLGNTIPSNTQITKSLDTLINLSEFSELLDSKLKAMQRSIIAEITNQIEDKISYTIKGMQQELTQEFNMLKSEQSKISTTFNEMEQRIKKLETKKQALEKEIHNLSLKVTQNLQNLQTPKLEQHYCCENNKKIVLYGLTENFDEDEYNLSNEVIDIFYDLYNVNLTGYIEDLRRLGKRGYRRPVMIELISKRMTRHILQNSIFLKNTGLYVSEFYDESGRKERRKLQEQLQSARKNGKYAKIRNNKLFVDGIEQSSEAEVVETFRLFDQLYNDNDLNKTQTKKNHSFRGETKN